MITESTSNCLVHSLINCIRNKNQDIETNSLKEFVFSVLNVGIELETNSIKHKFIELYHNRLSCITSTKAVDKPHTRSISVSSKSN